MIPAPVFCEHCGMSFVPRRADQRFCSVAHRNAWIARTSAAKRGDTLRGRVTTGSSRYSKDGGRLAHRKAAEVIAMRPLRKGEVVHHLDGSKRNNSPYNVIIMPSLSAHARLEKLGDAKAKKRGQVGRRVTR